MVMWTFIFTSNVYILLAFILVSRQTRHDDMTVTKTVALGIVACSYSIIVYDNYRIPIKIPIRYYFGCMGFVRHLTLADDFAPSIFPRHS